MEQVIILKRRRNKKTKEKAENPNESLIRLWHYFDERRNSLITVFLFIAIASISGLFGPYLMGKGIDNYLVKKDASGLLKIVLLMVGVYGVSSLFRWLQQYIMVGISQKTIKELRSELFNKMHSLSLDFFDTNSRGELMSRLTNDIENINAVLTQSMIQFFDSIISLTAVIVIMFTLNYKLTLITILVIPVLALITRYIAKYTHLYFSERQKHFGDLNGYIEEQITAGRVVKLNCQENNALDNFQQKNKQFKLAAMKARFLSSIIGPIMNLSNNFSFALIAGIGGFFAVQGLATIGTVAAFLNYVRNFNRPIQSMAQQFNQIQSALAGAERIFNILDKEVKLTEKENPLQVKKLNGKVDFENVDFSYQPEEKVLTDISFQVEAGETIALVGPTGAGKTTIINLISRFYDINKGNLLIDDQDIKDYKISDLRSNIGIVLQDTYLFAATIKDNIKYGKLSAAENEIKKAAKLANADRFIQNLADKYETNLTAGGKNLSQGQRQLISIARTILADPDLLILDEATSSIDTKTEKELQKAMDKLMSGRTTFVIAHRLSTIENADRIFLIENGQIIEKGSHQELLEEKGAYHSLYSSQFQDFDAV